MLREVHSLYTPTELPTKGWLYALRGRRIPPSLFLPVDWSMFSRISVARHYPKTVDDSAATERLLVQKGSPPLTKSRVYYIYHLELLPDIVHDRVV